MGRPRTVREAPWIELVLEAVRTQAEDAVGAARRIVDLRETYGRKATAILSGNGAALANFVCKTLFASSRTVEERPSVTESTAPKLPRRFGARETLQEAVPAPRGQRR